MNSPNNKLSTIKHLCKTYGINVVDENQDEIFLNCSKPIKKLEKVIAKLTGKTINWLSSDEEEENIFSNSDSLFSESVLEKIIISLMDAAFNTGAIKIRLEPGTKEYRWRTYSHRGWTTLQYIPIGTGKQLCDFFAKKSNIKDVHLPHHNHLKFNDQDFKCTFQPVWYGTVIQLELINNNNKQTIEIPEYFKKPTFSNLILINQRRHRHKQPLAQQIEELSKKHDVITIGDKIGINELATNFPTKADEVKTILESKPELVIINHHDIINTINLVKTLQTNNIKSIVNLTSYSPWPLLNYISNQKINSDAIVISMSGEKVCHNCKKQIDSQIKLNCHNETGVNDWLNKEVWGNQTCDTNHEDEDFYVVIENWNNDLNSADKKIADHIDQLILEGVITWKNKDDLKKDKNNSYFNF